MRNKIIVFLLLLNFITTLTVGYTLYTDNSDAGFAEVKEDYAKFKSNMYQGLSILMSGQSQLAANQQRLNIDIFDIRGRCLLYVQLNIDNSTLPEHLFALRALNY